ncbi:MAG TPA: CBS domain-containing protein [Blastocatellia bacterium]
MRALCASDVMVKDVITVAESTPLKDVARMFVEKKITGAPVVNDKGALTGVISETDIIRKTTSIGAWSPSTVSQIMTKPAVTVSPDETLQRVCEMMYNRRIHRVVVAEGAQIKGILTTMDILRAIAMNLKGGDDAFGASPRA